MLVLYEDYSSSAVEIYDVPNIFVQGYISKNVKCMYSRVSVYAVVCSHFIEGMYIEIEMSYVHIN